MKAMIKPEIAALPKKRAMRARPLCTTDPDAPNPAPESKNGGGFWSVSWWITVALIVYVLSTGPVFKLWLAKFEDNAIVTDIVKIAYKPLEVLSPKDTPQQAFFKWYILTAWKVQVPIIQ
jgi:hypothetical protein